MKNRLYLTLLGGMSNQAIAFAAATRLAQPIGAEVVCDLSFLKAHQDKSSGITPRQFELNTLLRVPAATVDHVPSEAISLEWEASSVPNDGKDYVVQGYWQRLAALPSYDDLRFMFTTSRHIGQWTDFFNMLHRFGPDTIGIHVRRGDYITQPNAFAFHGVMGVDYYKEAISLLRGKNGGLGASEQLVVYSDDVPWCKEHLVPQLGFADVLYAEDYIQDAATQLYSMSYVPYFAIGNSSFSWLGRLRAMGYGQKATVYPLKWFTSGTPENMFPPEWDGI
jgi:hypothetical protein